MSRQPPQQRHRRERPRRSSTPRTHAAGPTGGRGHDEARGRADGRAPYGADAAPAQPGRRLRLPGLRLAGPATRATGTPRSSARTAPRRSPRRRPCAASTASFFAEHSIDRAARQDRLLARPAGPDHRADGAARRGDPLRADRLGRGVRADRRAAQRARVARTRRSSTPPARPPTRRRSPTSSSPARYGTNNLPDCSNMCHESTSVGAGRGDRHRQGLGHASRTSTTPS